MSSAAADPEWLPTVSPPRTSAWSWAAAEPCVAPTPTIAARTTRIVIVLLLVLVRLFIVRLPAARRSP